VYPRDRRRTARAGQLMTLEDAVGYDSRAADLMMNSRLQGPVTRPAVGAGRSATPLSRGDLPSTELLGGGER
jgi:hypothetical protein